jgi:preprotein translocase subunit YajC
MQRASIGIAAPRQRHCNAVAVPLHRHCRCSVRCYPSALLLTGAPLTPQPGNPRRKPNRPMTSTLLILSAAAAGSPPAWTTFIPFVGMGLVFYFFLLRPQMQQQKSQKTKIDGIKKGDQVVTAGGLIGKVLRVDDAHVELELGPNVKVRAVRSTISDVLQPGGQPAND